MPLPVVAEKIERLRPMEEGGFGPQAGMVALRPTGVPAIVELLEEMGPKLPVKQAEISKIENRAEMLMSTLRNFVQAMAGDVEIRAVFPDRTMEMSNFSSLASKRKTTRPSSKKVAALTP